MQQLSEPDHEKLSLSLIFRRYSSWIWRLDNTMPTLQRKFMCQFLRWLN